MMIIFISLLAIILSVLALVGLHEYGHYLMARLCGIGVREFAIGFGPTFWTRTSAKTGIQYKVNLLPLGGYVKLIDGRESTLTPAEIPISFDQQPIYKRLFVVIAGPFMNFVFAFIAFWMMSAIGYMAVKPVIESVKTASLAEQSGLKAGQEIIAVDQKSADDWTQVLIPMILRMGDSGTMTISTKAQEYSIPLEHWRIDPLKPDLLLSLGIIPELPKTTPSPLVFEKRFNVVDSVKESYKLTSQFLWLNIVVIGKMLVGKISIQSLAGPLSLFQGAFLSFKAGLSAFLGFLAFISIAVGFVNILPIPGLDGAQVLYLLIEKFFKTPISIALQILLYKLGLILLSILFIQVLMNDLLRFYSGQ